MISGEGSFMIVIECILVFLLSLLFIYLVKRYASTLNLIDIPNERSTHTTHTPRGAGIGFFLAVACVYPFCFFEYFVEHLWTFFALFMVFTVGVLDDLKETSPNLKFVILILASIMLFFDKIMIDEVGVFFFFFFALGWFALPFTIFAVVGFTNALNLIDGLDGLSSSISIIILGGLFTIGFMHNDTMMMMLSAAFISSLLAFLVFNWHPASIFMGDSGSLTLGFVISLLSIKALAYVPTVSVLFLGAIPIIDTIIVMVRRKLNGRSMFAADHCHIHHVLRHFFAENTPKTVLFLTILQAIYTVTALQLSKEIDEGFLLILFMLNIALVYMFLMAMIKRQNRKC